MCKPRSLHIDKKQAYAYKKSKYQSTVSEKNITFAMYLRPETTRRRPQTERAHLRHVSGTRRTETAARPTSHNLNPNINNEPGGRPAGQKTQNNHEKTLHFSHALPHYGSRKRADKQRPGHRHTAERRQGERVLRQGRAEIRLRGRTRQRRRDNAQRRTVQRHDDTEVAPHHRQRFRKGRGQRQVSHDNIRQP